MKAGTELSLQAVAARHTAVAPDLKHVSAECFLAEILIFHHAKEPTVVSKAEFRINFKGLVQSFSVALDIINMPDDLITCRRVLALFYVNCDIISSGSQSTSSYTNRDNSFLIRGTWKKVRNGL